MELLDLLGPEDVVLGLRASSKDDLIEELSRRAARTGGLPVERVHRALVAREALGSTGVGSGVALPHAKIVDLRRPVALLCRLERPLDYAAIDEKPVDLVLLLLTAEGADKEHLRLLSQASRRLREKTIRDALRKASAPAEALVALSG